MRGKAWEDQVMRGKAWEIRSCEGRPGRSGHAREGLGDQVMRGKAWEVRSCEGRPGRSGHVREGLGDQVMYDHVRLTDSKTHRGQCPTIVFASIRRRSAPVSIDCLPCKCSDIQPLDITRKGIEFLCWAPPSVCLPCAYLMAPHVTSSPRPSPAAYSEHWWWEWPRNEAMWTTK